MGAWSWPPRAELDILRSQISTDLTSTWMFGRRCGAGANGSHERSAHPGKSPVVPVVFEREKRTSNYFEPLRQTVWRSMLPSRRWGQKVESMVLAERR